MTEADRYLEDVRRRKAQGVQKDATAIHAHVSAPTGVSAAGSGWFTAEGRLNRMSYFLRVLCVLPVALLGSGLCESAPAFGLPLLIAAVSVNALQAVKRFHDLGQSGWMFLLLLVPVVNLFVGLWLLFGPGVVGSNQYGPKPV